jgi:hypothetical protein
MSSLLYVDFSLSLALLILYGVKGKSALAWTSFFRGSSEFSVYLALSASLPYPISRYRRRRVPLYSPYCPYCNSTVTPPFLCQALSTTFGLTCRNPYPSVSYGIAPFPLSTRMSTISNERKTRSQCATRSHVSRISVPAANSRVHPLPIPLYVTPPVSGTAQDVPVPHLVHPPRRSPIMPSAPQVTIPADAVIGGPVGAVPEIPTQTVESGCLESVLSIRVMCKDLWKLLRDIYTSVLTE